MSIDWTRPRADVPPLVILDMDGVLLHLDLDRERMRADIARAFAVAGVAHAFQPAASSPFMSTVESACTTVGARDPEAGQRLRHAVWRIVGEEELRAARRCQPTPGARALVEALAGRPVGLFTNNGREAVGVALQRAGIPEHAFVDIQARHDSGAIKPSAGPVMALVEAAARHLGGVPERVFLVGDHPGDMQSALAAQARLAERGWPGTVVPVAVRTPWRSDRDMEDAGAWLIATDLAEAGRLVTAPRVDASLSLVLLALDEEATIAQAIEDARRFCRLYCEKGYEIVVVDDGSTDDTSGAAERASEGDVVLVRHTVNQGMGAAMRDGYLAATCEYIAPLPADRQVRPQALAGFLPHLAPDRVVHGYYVVPHSGQARKWLSEAFRLAVRNVGDLHVDFAGTYLFHRKWLDVVDLHGLVSDTFLFSFELLEHFRRAGCTFAAEVVHPFPREVGTSRVVGVKRIARVFREIVRYRVNALRARGR